MPGSPGARLAPQNKFISMMTLLWPLSRYQTLLSFTCLWIFYYAYRHLKTGASRRRFIASNGCKPLRKWRNKDPFLGIDFLWDSYRAIKEHRALQMTKDRFDLLGVNTVQVSILRMTVVATVEPENLKSVLASDFRNYSLPDGRKKLLGPVLGEGIFTTDGKEWVLSFLALMTFFLCCNGP